MSHHDQGQPEAYPPPLATAPHPNENSHIINPANYPAKDGEIVPPPEKTRSKGDGFWRGCCAGWCCYCCLDACF